jgi:GntR family transcriptional regulator
MAIETVMMPIALLESLEGDIETGSLHEAFQRAGSDPTRAMAAVTARRATRAEREQLALRDENAVLLCETRTIWDQNGRPLERTQTCYVADRYAFEALIEGGDV